MEIPDYVVKAALRHYKRIAENAKADKNDSRTADALRLAKADIKKLEKRVKNNNSDPR